MKREEKLFKELKYLKNDIRNSEMESAKEKLDNPKIPIKEIAIEVLIGSLYTKGFKPIESGFIILV